MARKTILVRWTDCLTSPSCRPRYLLGGGAVCCCPKAGQVTTGINTMTANSLFITGSFMQIESSLLQFGHAVAASVGHPDVSSLGRDLKRECPDCDGFEHRTIAGSEPHHVVAVLVRHPDVPPIKRYTTGCFPHLEFSQDCTIAGSQLRHTVAFVIGHPDVSPVKRHAERNFSHTKGPEHGAIARL